MQKLDRLSFLDTSFLALEQPNTHMHVGSVAIFDGSDMPGGKLDIERVRAFISARLDLVPRYRQRLAWIPVEQYPVWIDDENFDLDYHVRHTALPKPGTEEQLKRLAGRLMSQQLDRAKPLWELWFVEGLPDGKFGVISKIHHCMIDGISGVDLMAVMYNLAPDGAMPEPSTWKPTPTPTGAELVVGDVARRLRSTIDRLSNAGQLVEDSQQLVMRAIRKATAVSASLASGWLKRGIATPLNQHIGPNRRFDWTAMPLSDVKSVKAALGGSVNDVVLAIVAGAVRHFFLEHRSAEPPAEYRAMAPVSVRSESQRGTLGNQVAMWLVDLPVDDPDPLSRYRKVMAATTKLKETDQALGAATLVQMSSGAPITLVSLASRLAAGRRPFATTITNVPGPQFPLYLLEARLEHQYALVPLWENHGYAIALFSYNGEVAWGINADWDLMPDTEAFVACLHDAFSELRAAAQS